MDDNIKSCKTVGELVSKLSKLSPSLPVVMSKDAEGNSYSPYSDISVGKYCPDSTWSGDYSEETEYDDYHECICLWPIN